MFPLHGYADTLATLALIVLPFAVGCSHRTPTLLFYVIVGGAGLLATLAALRVAGFVHTANDGPEAKAA